MPIHPCRMVAHTCPFILYIGNYFLSTVDNAREVVYNITCSVGGFCPELAPEKAKTNTNMRRWRNWQTRRSQTPVVHSRVGSNPILRTKKHPLRVLFYADGWDLKNPLSQTRSAPATSASEYESKAQYPPHQVLIA